MINKPLSKHMKYLINHLAAILYHKVWDDVVEIIDS